MKGSKDLMKPDPITTLMMKAHSVGCKDENGIVFPLTRVMFETYLSAYFGSDVSQGCLILCPIIRGALAYDVNLHRLPRPLEGVVARTKPLNHISLASRFVRYCDAQVVHSVHIRALGDKKLRHGLVVPADRRFPAASMGDYGSAVRAAWRVPEEPHSLTPAAVLHQ